MLAIRMQRTGRKGHAMFRVVVQDSRVTPTSGKVVALLGSYDPHAKTVVLDKAKTEQFLKNGAQPSDRAISLFKKEGVKLPSWATLNTKKAGTLRNPEKLRKNQPKETKLEEAVEAEPVEAPVVETEAQESTPEAVADDASEKPAEAKE